MTETETLSKSAQNEIKRMHELAAKHDFQILDEETTGAEEKDALSKIPVEKKPVSETGVTKETELETVARLAAKHGLNLSSKAKGKGKSGKNYKSVKCNGYEVTDQFGVVSVVSCGHIFRDRWFDHIRESQHAGVDPGYKERTSKK